MRNCVIKELSMKVFVSKLKSKLISIITDRNKMKAIYLLWVMVHFILLFVSGNFRPSIDNYCGCSYSVMVRFSPFECCYGRDSTYDISEFLIYVSLPVCLYYAGKLWFKGKK